jgi:hypothetical protein
MKPSSQSPRTSSPLSESVQHKLNLYALAASAAGVGLLAFSQTAEAQIVFTPAHVRLPSNQDFFLDLNNDGINDFKFHASTYDGDCRLNAAKSCVSVDGAFLWLYPQAAGNAVVGPASALASGVRIGPRQAFNSGSVETMGYVRYNFGLHYGGAWADSGKTVNAHYLGLKFVVNGETHYGWARFNVRIFRQPESKLYAVLTGYAYETVPNKPILTGQTKEAEAIPIEPASLGHLAAGAAAIPAWRPEK